MRRCFCCWRLVRPAGDPAAAEEALLVRGKSQLILHGSPRPRPRKAPACFSQLPRPAVPQRATGRALRDARVPSAGGPRLLQEAGLGGSPGPGRMGGNTTLGGSWSEESSRAAHAALPSRSRRANQPERRPDRPAPRHPRFRPLRAPPPLRGASSPSAPARTCEKRRRSAVRRQPRLPFPPCWA